MHLKVYLGEVKDYIEKNTLAYASRIETDLYHVFIFLRYTRANELKIPTPHWMPSPNLYIPLKSNRQKHKFFCQNNWQQLFLGNMSDNLCDITLTGFYKKFPEVVWQYLSRKINSSRQSQVSIMRAFVVLFSISSV